MLALADRLGARVTNLAGPAWRPHVTFAVIDRLPEHLPPCPEIVERGPWTATPALGRIGDFRHVSELLHDAD